MKNSSPMKYKNHFIINESLDIIMNQVGNDCSMMCQWGMDEWTLNLQIFAHKACLNRKRHDEEKREHKPILEMSVQHTSDKSIFFYFWSTFRVVSSFYAPKDFQLIQ